MYCSELVYKAYSEGAGRELAPLRSFQDYGLRAPEVQEAVQARWGPSFDPEALVIGPADLMASDALRTL